MTPQEALVQALMASTKVYGTAEEEATDILAALPEGWALVDDSQWVSADEEYLRLRAEGAQQERERLRALAWHPYSDRGGDGVQYGQCLVCGDDGLSEADADAFFAEPTDDR